MNFYKTFSRRNFERPRNHYFYCMTSFNVYTFKKCATGNIFPSLTRLKKHMQKKSLRRVLLKGYSERPQACNFIKIETLAQVFSCEFYETSKNTFFYRIPLVAASVWFRVEILCLNFPNT